MPALYDFPRSSACYRVRIACALKGVELDIKAVNLREGVQRSEDYKKIAPSGLVPTLVEDDGTTLSQSLAILMRLETLYPEPPLIPADEVTALRAWEMALAIACDIHPLNNLRVLKFLESEFSLDESSRLQWYAHWIALGFSGLETKVASSAGRYCVGDMLSIADVCLVPQMANARRFDVDLSAYPRLVEIDARLRELPAFAAAAPA